MTPFTQMQPISTLDEQVARLRSAMPAPHSPMPTAARPLGPPQKPSVNFAGIAKQALPAILALMARKQGGPEAGAALLNGFTRQIAAKRQAEKDAFELELQTTQSEQARQDRIAERNRQEQIQRANWVTNLQAKLAEIDDPVAFASTVDLADKVGTSAFGFQPGEIKGAFQFPKGRETQRVSTEATDLIEKLKRTHGTNFDALVAANAVVTFGGKPTPIQDVMSVAGVLAKDDKGQAVLPQPKPKDVTFGSPFEVMVGNRRKHVRAGSDGKTYDLGGNVVPESVIRPIAPAASGGGGSHMWVVRNGEPVRVPESQVQLGDKPYDAVAARQPAGLSDGKAEALDTAQEVKRIASALRTHAGFNGAFGVVDSWLPTLKQSTADAVALRDSLMSLLTLENMGKMKGVLSDRDMEVLRKASTTLTASMSEGAARAELNRLVEVMDKVLGGGPIAPVTDIGGARGFSVVAPDGKTYSFPNQAALDAFKRKAGIR
jgi:hypothetical protein